MPALSALSTSSFAVIELVGLDQDGERLSPEETWERVRTGRQADETYLAVTPRPGFAEMGAD
jgi:hypothetical protein